MVFIFFIARIRHNIQILTELKPLGDDDIENMWTGCQCKPYS